MMNNINQAVKNFKKDSDARLNKFCTAKQLKFFAPAFSDAKTQERMMRIGMEARALNATNEDEYYLIALATLQNDFMRHNA